MILNIFFFILVGLVGLAFGSFATYFSYRLIEKKTLAGRSFCPKCFHVLSFIDLIPIFSYIFFKGKCRFCSAKIDSFYIKTEITFFLFSQFTFLLAGYDLLNTFILLLVFLACYVITLVDLKQMWIPDSMNCLLFILSIIFYTGNSYENGIFWRLLCGFAIFLFKFSYEFFRKVITKQSCEMIGFGDIKLFFAICPFFVPMDFVILIIFACIFHLLSWIISCRNHKVEMPFGPQICFCFLVLLCLKVFFSASVFDVFMDRFLLTIFY